MKQRRLMIFRCRSSLYIVGMIIVGVVSITGGIIGRHVPHRRGGKKEEEPTTSPIGTRGVKSTTSYYYN